MTRRAPALLVLLVGQLRPVAQAPVSAPAPPVATSTVTVTPGPTTACDRTQATCQALLVRAWRATVYEVVADYLDPEGSYFNASSYYARDETEGLWATKRGALGMEVFRVGGGATQVTVQIADNGVGLPAARDRIVEPYMTTRARGTGLGLAIVNKIVEEHGGEMTFASAAGGGTQVTMRFARDPLGERSEAAE